MSKSLYHIEQEYLDLANQLEQGELTAELETALAINQSELQGKAIAYAFVVIDKLGNVDAIDVQLARLTALKKSELAIAEKLKEKISNAMQFYGITEVKSELVKLSFRKSKQTVGSSEDLDKEFLTVKPESYSPNLTAIKAAIEEGREVKGYQVLEKLSLQIK
jgi:hypothetical protein